MRISHALQAALIIALFYFFRVLPLDAASWIGGRIGRLIGPLLKHQCTIARCNLALAFPEKSDAERERILRGMWEHLGRNAAEMGHFRGNALYSRISCKQLYYFPAPGQQVLFISGHVGHWELTYPVPFEHGVPVTVAYRHLNNTYLDRFMVKLRSSHCNAMFPKGPKGSVRMMSALKRKESIALLVDQKMNEGIAVPFFGREAMTAPAVAQLALRFKLPIIPARVMRTQGCHFVAAAYPPLDVPRTGDEEADIRAIMLAINKLLENWICEYPEQWLWIHRRWEKDMYV